MIMKTNITVKLILPAFGPSALYSVDKETDLPVSMFRSGTSGLDIGQLTDGGFLYGVSQKPPPRRNEPIAEVTPKSHIGGGSGARSLSAEGAPTVLEYVYGSDQVPGRLKSPTTNGFQSLIAFESSNMNSLICY